MLHDEELLREATSNLRPFFNVLKTADRNIKFAFITGVSRFRNTTVFSGFNNPSDISLNEKYAGMLGLTQEEVEANFKSGIEGLAEKYGYDYDTMLTVLKINTTAIGSRPKRNMSTILSACLTPSTS